MPQKILKQLESEREVSVDYVDIKRLMYIAMTLMGVLMVFLASRVPIVPDPEHFSVCLAALIFLLVGSALVIFGVLTYLFRQDPDIWR